MKMIASQSKKTFYTSEEAVDEIYAAKSFNGVL